MYRKGFVNDYYFDQIDCKDKAYLLGFFIADGCIKLQPRCKNSYALILNNSIDDEEVIRFYQERICPDNILEYYHYTKGAINRKPTVLCKWTSTHMKETLERYNIGLRKTYDDKFTFNFDIIPKNLQWDFLRGLLDGDGTITSRGYLSFIVNSPLFGEQIKNILEQDNICWCVIDRVVKSIIPYWVVRVNGTNHDKRTSILKIYHKLYDDKYYYLQRKKIKFEEYLDIK